MAEPALLSPPQKPYNNTHSIISSGSKENLPGDVVTPCSSCSRKLLVAGAASFAFCLLSVAACLLLSFLLRRWRRGPAGLVQEDEGQPKPGGGGGLSAAAIALLPASFPYRRRGNDPEVECAVCIGVLDEGQTARQLPGCVHVFHQQCVDAWLASNASCPVCRRRTGPRARQGEEEEAAEAPVQV